MVHVKKKKKRKKKALTVEFYLQRLAEPFQRSCHVLLISVKNAVGHFEKSLTFVLGRKKQTKKTHSQYSHLPVCTLHVEYQRASQSGTPLAQDQHFSNQSEINRPQQGINHS